MRFRSSARSTASFYDLFSRSRPAPRGRGSLLAEMLGRRSRPRGRRARMREAEHAADETTHAIVQRVNRTFVTPFDREDIYALASGLDDVMDMMDEAVDLILLYEVTILPAGALRPGRGAPALRRADREAMPRLQSMGDLDEYWIEINRLENQGDKSYRRILAKLFSGESQALEVLKLKDIVTSLEGAIDAFEKVANIVEQIAVKES